MAPAAAPRSLVQAHSDLYGAIARVELLGSDAPLVWRRDDVALQRFAEECGGLE